MQIHYAVDAVAAGFGDQCMARREFLPGIFFLGSIAPINFIEADLQIKNEVLGSVSFEADVFRIAK